MGSRHASRLPLLAALGLAAGAPLALAAAGDEGAARPELGRVRWGRSLPDAQAEARRLGRPSLILVAEDLFVPVAIFNNLGGADRAALERFGEPSWNNPVVRIVDADLGPLAPRVSGDYSQVGLLDAMQAGLTTAERPVPAYLRALADELAPARPALAHYAMYCFWSGEVCLGELEGVLETRAGFAGGKEVVEVRYDPARTTAERLDAAAAACGTRVSGAGFRASAADDKYQLRGGRWAALAMTPGQRTKVNARVGRGAKVADLLSPRQQAALQE